jgi:uncharacterized protein (DUF488 family)
MKQIKLFTIGFTKKNAETFFNRIKSSDIKCVIDIRLNNVSQLAGFAKKDDLAFFLKEICACTYKHLPQLAPTKEILDDYQKKNIDWCEYEARFNKLIRQRDIGKLFAYDALDMSCLLCSEPSADKCHRRLVAEYFKQLFGNVDIIHL